MYDLNDYDYHLPSELIAQTPLAQRDRSRLLGLQRGDGKRSHGRFADLADLLDKGDVLVRNDTRVIPGRLLGKKSTGGKVEVLILDYAQGVADKVFHCLVRASKGPKPGSRLFFEQGVEAVVKALDDGVYILSFRGDLEIDEALSSIGHVPLPPYIQRQDNKADRTTYQTVYATHKGAIAAPTAGLHFTEPLLDRLSQKGVKIADLTLHVGYGTFVPVRAEDIREHRMHAEWFTLPTRTAEVINKARTQGRRIVAVGTTCVRTLEHCADDHGRITAQNGWCDLFIYPGYEFKLVDAMITNFHLPQSTLLMLVSAFAGREAVLKAYAEAVERKYRFYSYGDAMFIY